MGIHYLKQNDTGLFLEVTLLDPDESVHDLSVGSPSVKLHIILADKITILLRSMTIFNPTGGVVRYQWADADWLTGNLVPSPSHFMEYEVLRAVVPTRLSFPNNEFDTLFIHPHIADGSL